MKAIAINGSPRKGWNTESLLKEALRGARDVGAETKLVQLYDLQYTGCKSCFACKRIGAESCRCALKDGLSPVLEDIHEADLLFVGSPIYFGDITGQTVSFIERLFFPMLSYDDYSKRLFEGRINAAFFFTMNAKREYYENLIQSRTNMLTRLGGKVESYAACDTYQFSDYSKYHSGSFDAQHKAQVRQEQFPKDLLAAYDIGRRLAEDIKAR